VVSLSSRFATKIFVCISHPSHEWYTIWTMRSEEEEEHDPSQISVGEEE
jgi:hypothetical protein